MSTTVCIFVFDEKIILPSIIEEFTRFNNSALSLSDLSDYGHETGEEIDTFWHTVSVNNMIHRFLYDCYAYNLGQNSVITVGEVSHSFNDTEARYGAGTGVPQSLYMLDLFYRNRGFVVQLTPENIKAITVLFNSKLDSSLELVDRKTVRTMKKKVKRELNKHVGKYSFIERW